MSSQELRAELTSRLIQKLVRELSNSKDEKVLVSLELQSLGIIRNHRSISINRYEVRRKLDDLKEKFIVDNFKEYADHLENLCKVVINHPICLEHDEVDIQWSLLELLFSIACNPTGALRRNKHKIIIASPERTREDTFAQLEELYFKSVLKEDFVTLQDFGGNSDLSDWSGSDNEIENEISKSKLDDAKAKANASDCNAESVRLAEFLPVLQAPTKEQPFQLYEDKSNLKDCIRESVQNSWWLPEKMHDAHQVATKRMEGNFATLLDRYLRKRTNGFQNFREPSTTSEFCLLRELIWVFYLPEKCKYFSIISGKCRLHENVTIPSISAPTLSQYLEHNILPYVNQMHSLRRFLKDISGCQDQRLPRTFEYYAASLKGLVEQILDKFIELEERVVAQRDFEINTLITLQANLRHIFEQIQIIYSIHKASVLDYRKYPANITSLYLLTSLMNYSNTATRLTESHLAISLFMASVKAFCNIIDCWWNEGRLDDWQQEFLVACNSDQSVTFRLYKKDEERAFFVPKDVSKIIGDNRFMHLLQEHSIEAGYTLNLLYEISRIGDLRNECGVIGVQLFDAFVVDVFQQLRNRKIETNDLPDTSKTNITVAATEDKSYDDNSENLTTNDEFLLLLFNDSKTEMSVTPRHYDTCDALKTTRTTRYNALEMFRELMEYKHMLPLEEIILNSFGRILRERITFANRYVVELYRGNVNILKHLQNIRKVLLLEASDIMQQFYSTLFNQMEAGKPWANDFVLTMQLDDMISSKYPDMSSLFRIELNSTARSQTQKVTEAVEALTVSYSFSNELAKIITDEDMQVYNDVFRFLLKVKWGLATLESLRFSRTRRRPAYAPLEMGDFLMRRLEQLRFWMFYGVQCIHSHLMMHVLQAMGSQLDEKLRQSENVREMERVHKSYLATISEHCFLKENLSRIKLGIEQMLNLVFILRAEWQSCLRYLDQCMPLAIDISNDEFEDYALTAEIDTIELTYIRCHQYLANMLNNEVYIYNNYFLSGLSAAFNTSLPC